MDIQSSTLDSLFELYPVIIPGWITPVKPAGLADGGIPKSLYDDQPQGLQCLIDPWSELKRQSWTMAAWDRVDLYVNDNSAPVAGDTVQPGEEGNRMPLYLPHGRLIHGVNRLHYVVTRPSDNSSQPSRDLFVLYHLRAPGDPAPEGLDLLIPSDVIRDGVSADRAAQGVEFGFAYTNPRNYDRIDFLLGDVTVPFEVVDASTPVVKTLFTDTFLQVGDNANTLIQYRVTDQLGNANQSPTKRLDIHLGSALILPTLDSVKAADVEVPEGASTVSTILKLSGQAHKGQNVEIFEGNDPNAVSKGQATADTVTGTWELEITVELGPRRLYAKSLYHSGNVYSNVRTLKVVKPIILDPSIMVLDGAEVFAPASYRWTQTNLHGPGNRRIRTPTDGTPPYQYVSANAEIATVGSTDGDVIGQRNGQTLISVTDAHGQVASYQVQVSNKWDIEKRDEYASGQTLWGWSSQMPGLESRPSFVSGLREAIIRRLPDPSQYFHPIWDPNLGVIAHGRVSGHGDWPPGDGEITLHFYNSDGSIGLATRRASEVRVAAGWGFRPRYTPQLLADTTEIYSAVVKAGARLL